MLISYLIIIIAIQNKSIRASVTLADIVAYGGSVDSDKESPRVNSCENCIGKMKVLS